MRDCESWYGTCYYSSSLGESREGGRLRFRDLVGPTFRANEIVRAKRAKNAAKSAGATVRKGTFPEDTAVVLARINVSMSIKSINNETINSIHVHSCGVREQDL